MAVTAISRQKPCSVNALDDQRWQLVLAHSTTSQFFYAVISTKIFCRPSCPSRRPRRANVCFFDTVTAAKAQGFRACKRCKPDAVGVDGAAPPTSEAAARETVAAACAYIRSVNGDTALADVAHHVGLSPRYFHGLFKQVTSVTPGVFSARVRQQYQYQTPIEEALAQQPLPLLSSIDTATPTPALTLSPGSEQQQYLATPTLPSLPIDYNDGDEDFMLSFYGSADAYAELDGFDVNSSLSWDDVLNFEHDQQQQLFDFSQFSLPLTSSQKSAG